jgi:hypothetical protein
MKIGIIFLIYTSTTLFLTSQNLPSELDIEFINTYEITLPYNVNPRASIIHGKIFIDGDNETQ